jgi:hypothetical protein
MDQKTLSGKENGKEIEKENWKAPIVKGAISPESLVRAVMLMSEYDKARQNGDKHSVAITQSVEVTRQHYPEMPISNTGLKRILAELRPKAAKSVLLYERSTLSEEELEKLYWIEEQLAPYRQKKGLKLPAPSDAIPPRSLMTFKIRIDDRPNYPRHNAKPPKE